MDVLDVLQRRRIPWLVRPAVKNRDVLSGVQQNIHDVRAAGPGSSDEQRFHRHTPESE